MSGHTPGPWKVERRRNRLRVIYEGPPASCVIAKIGDARNPAAEADARFIARACNAHEDMLAALEAVTNVLLWEEDYEMTLAQVNAAIARATKDDR